MATPSKDYAIVLTTAGSEEQATTLARELVERRLAACVNIIPDICSIYRWKGKIWQDEEKLLVIKTAADLFGKVRSTIRSLHSYEMPEAILIPMTDADPAILLWLADCLQPRGEGDEE